MTSDLLLDLHSPPDTAWRAALDRTGVHLGAACSGHNLVQCTSDASATRLVCLAAGLTPELEAALSCWQGTPPLAVLLLTPGRPVADADAPARAVALGVHHWQPLPLGADGTLDAAALDFALSLALARHRHEDALRAATASARAQLDERKWVDRAKGVLMSALGLDEDGAFRLLRGAAMSVNLRIGELSQAVFESARWADAMNRAGQLRMLSQRLVRLAAQQLLRIDPRDAALQSAQSSQRLRDNLALLTTQCAGTAAEADCAHAARCWQALSDALAAPRLDASGLRRIDALGTTLLEAAEQLTQALQAAVGRRALHVVNQCGRQRMRVQRIAKDSLLAALASSSAPRPPAAEALAEFEAAQRELEDLPLTSPEIRTTLAQVRDEWLRLLGGVRDAGSAPGRRALVQASEALLVRLDSLTAAYEHSFQVIMG